MAPVELPQYSEQVGVRLDDSGERLHSRVEDVEPKRLLLAVPSDGTQEVQLPVGVGVAVEWVTPRGLARVPGRHTGPGGISIPTVAIAVVGDPEIFQRREYVRAPAAIHVRVASDDEEFPGVSVDISGGGVRATIPNFEADVDTVIDLWLDLPDRAVAPTARVLRFKEPDEYVLVFETIDEKDRERVIHHVFERLRAAAWNR